MSAPSPAEVDIKADRYYELKSALEAATEKAKLLCLPLITFKEELIQLVRDFGSAHAEKSRLLHGITSEMIAHGPPIAASAIHRDRGKLPAPGMRCLSSAQLADGQ